MNSVHLLGRLTKDVILSKNGDMTIARITLAVDRKTKEDSADFIGCVAFGKTAELIDQYVKKGSKIAIEGRIQTGSYTNKDGQKVYTTDVVVNSIDFCDKKADKVNADFVTIPDNVADEELPFN